MKWKWRIFDFAHVDISFDYYLRCAFCFVIYLINSTNSQESTLRQLLNSFSNSLLNLRYFFNENKLAPWPNELNSLCQEKKNRCASPNTAAMNEIYVGTIIVISSLTFMDAFVCSSRPKRWIFFISSKFLLFKREKRATLTRYPIEYRKENNEKFATAIQFRLNLIIFHSFLICACVSHSSLNILLHIDGALCRNTILIDHRKLEIRVNVSSGHIYLQCLNRE